ncbi:hypothetical protein JTE90_019244 [Oedothorax gibbosus]|uniref:Ribosomal protein L32 n=1 Tax=Oedothorax gibbosus TaxID=931172 RepID=A0AAV6US56_9ARAC|nr:hypothetical protein JTE90_019244 [Oedothorax gibbosus]
MLNKAAAKCTRKKKSSRWNDKAAVMSRLSPDTAKLTLRRKRAARPKRLLYQNSTALYRKSKQHFFIVLISANEKSNVLRRALSYRGPPSSITRGKKKNLFPTCLNVLSRPYLASVTPR